MLMIGTLIENICMAITAEWQQKGTLHFHSQIKRQIKAKLNQHAHKADGNQSNSI